MTASHTQEHHPRTLGVAGWFFYLLLLALMFALAFWAARWGWAEVLAAEPRNVMNNWKTGQVMPSDEELSRLNGLLERAQLLNNQNADIAFDQGRLAEWRAQQYSLWAKEAYKYREEAISHFKEALDIRPSWGLAWINLANSLVLNQQLYSGGMAALEKAAVLAWLEADVQKRVIWLGLSLWHYMNDEQRQRMRHILEYSLMYQREITIMAIVNFHMENELADMLTLKYYRDLLRQKLDMRKRLHRLGSGSKVKT